MEEKLEDFLNKLSKKLGQELTIIPGGETFKNSKEQGFGYRVAIGTTKKLIRLNFDNKNSVDINKLNSIDIFTGSRNPFANITIENYNDELISKIAQLINNPSSNVNTEAAIDNRNNNAIQVSRGGNNEVYGRDEQEREITNNMPSLDYKKTLRDLKALVIGLVKGVSNALFILGRGGSGKTHSVEATLNAMGLEDGEEDGYFKLAGAASASEVYRTLYNNRNGIILFDDCDSAFGDETARNLIKAATDTKKIRKMSYAKTASWLYNPDKETVSKDQDGVDKFPKHFNFEGRIIVISNLPLNKLDPDGAIRTRALIINVNPSDAELIDYMAEIIDKIQLNDGLQLSHEDRLKALTIVKSSKRKEDISIRKLLRTMNFLASGLPDAEDLAKLYA